MYYQRAIVYKNIRETRIANLQRQQFPNRPNKWERPKDDPLQKFLDRKQAQHKLVRVNLQEAKPLRKKIICLLNACRRKMKKRWNANVPGRNYAGRKILIACTQKKTGRQLSRLMKLSTKKN